MKKYLSLIKASMTEGMNLFKISTKKTSAFSKKGLPIVLAILVMGAMFGYADSMMEILEPAQAEYMMLTLFVTAFAILTLIEGIYKAGNLLFNCKDDNMLLSLPIKKSTVLFTRVFKFYVFELLYNTLFLLPAMAVYAMHKNPEPTFYLVSIVAIILFPIVPIVISCVIGALSTLISSRFKGKSYVQTVISMAMILLLLFVSYNMQGLMTNVADNASYINEIIGKIYYPTGAYVDLVLNFDVLKFVIFILAHLVLFAVTILVLGKVYFKINSLTKSIKTGKTNKNYKVKTSRPMSALIKKEFKRFINSTVFVTNAGFGLVLFIIGCIIVCVNFEGLLGPIIESNPDFVIEDIKALLPIGLLGFVCMSSFMTSITSSMISLEGKSFSILKSLPVKPYTVVKSKVYTAVLIMIPFLLIGDIIVFVRFNFDILSMAIIVVESVLLPLVAETIGIIINLKYPRMDAKNDTEVVKQSMSSTVSVFIGMGAIGVTAVALFMALGLGLNMYVVMGAFLVIYTIIYDLLSLYLLKTSEKSFNNIVV